MIPPYLFFCGGSLLISKRNLENGNEEGKVEVVGFRKEMEILVGPTIGMEATTSAAAAVYVRERSEEKVGSSCFFLKEEDVGVSNLGSPDVSSESSSSIGSPGDSEDEEEDGVVSSGTSGGLAYLGSLEDSLPIKLVPFSIFLCLLKTLLSVSMLTPTFGITIL